MGDEDDGGGDDDDDGSGDDDDDGSGDDIFIDKLMPTKLPSNSHVGQS